MSARDDDHDDDAQLKQLRSVWVSMREEEPSDRGMAALMAAARTKAAELEQAAQPSWWQRIAATLRRPPVLALATVTLLFGGAVIVTQRSASMKSSAVVETETADKNDELGYSGEGVATKGEAAGSAAVVDTTVASPIADPAAVAPPAVDKVVRDYKQPRSGPKLAKDKAPETTVTATKPRPEPIRERDDFADKPQSGPSDGAALKTPTAPRPGGSSAPLAIAQDSDPAPVEEPATGRGGGGKAGSKPEPKKPIARTPAPPIEGEDRVTPDTKTDATKAQAQQTTLDQLVKQCETAAAKGDCPTVRSLAQRIFSTSPAAYKTRVANKPAIVRCLPQDADNASAAE